MDRDTHRQLIVDTLEASGLEVDAVGEDRWMTVLEGEWKRTLPVLLQLDERSLRITALLTGVPDEGHAAVYGLVLHRNERLTWVHYALDDEGDIVLVGAVPRAILSADVLDEVLGQLLHSADTTFNAVLRTGFAGYLAREQAWRRKMGMAPNPIGDPTPADE